MAEVRRQLLLLLSRAHSLTHTLTQVPALSLSLSLGSWDHVVQGRSSNNGAQKREGKREWKRTAKGQGKERGNARARQRSVTSMLNVRTGQSLLIDRAVSATIIINWRIALTATTTRKSSILNRVRFGLCICFVYPCHHISDFY